tara:strand:- start:1910 stop:2341 length:432 start_codon:yes stop_codon:yes gene_type:complete
MSKVENGSVVSVHYVGTLDDGTEFDSSRKTGTPLLCEVGSGNIIKGFDQALVGMEIGETKSVSVAPEEAYGEIVQEAFQTVSKSNFPPEFNFNVGEAVQGQGQDGNLVRAQIEAVEDDSVTLNFNHPMAGKNLNFEIELLEIK